MYYKHRGKNISEEKKKAILFRLKNGESTNSISISESVSSHTARLIRIRNGIPEFNRKVPSEKEEEVLKLLEDPRLLTTYAIASQAKVHRTTVKKIALRNQPRREDVQTS